jgi:transcriptional regulator with XRE-family HTH domain
LTQRQSRQPRRPHFIEAWARIRGYDKPVRLADALNVHRGQITRWYKGQSPDERSQEKLAALFNIQPSDLFSNPDDVWFSHFLRGRDMAEIERIKNGLEANFPRPLALDTKANG